jgi:glycosyltransferase involved in cell wall biosynthesis
MRGGAGIKNKILQAWAMGLPVVSTPEGAHGLDARDGENILVRGTPKAFAQAVCALLTSPAERERIGAAGRATVCAQYSWEKKACELEQLFARAVAKRGLRTG